jgi:hypothetical protein
MKMHNVVDFSSPEPAESGPVITLRISGNRLIGLLNTIDGLMFETGKYAFKGDDYVFRDEHAKHMRDLTESIRDELSAQRNNTTAKDIRASLLRTQG